MSDQVCSQAFDPPQARAAWTLALRFALESCAQLAMATEGACGGPDPRRCQPLARPGRMEQGRPSPAAALPWTQHCLINQYLVTIQGHTLEISLSVQ